MKLSNQHILYLILLISVILRFWNYFEIPFSHDEFSALFRTGHPNFFELITYGVVTDTHPAGVQIFMNYWILLFGDAPWIVKLPFTLMGVASVYLLYRLGQLWFNETVGLISCSFLASLQFSIMYSQLARPYISGMFLCLIMVWYWSKLVKDPEKDFWRNGLSFALVTAACAYNHHFSLLFAAVVGLSGVYFLPIKTLAKYAVLGLIAFLLYVPHLGIFMHQLSQGGVGGPDGWLGAPDMSFFGNYLHYIFHFSWIMVILVLGLFIFGILRKRSVVNLKQTALFLVWFLLPIIIGFFYSIYRNPVLQFSVVIFSFPYLFFVLFGHFRKLSVVQNATISIIILASSIITLTAQRQHYNVFYNSAYKEILINQHQEKLKNDETLRIIEMPAKMKAHYNEHLDIDTNYIDAIKYEDERQLMTDLEKGLNNYDRVFYGFVNGSNPHHFNAIRHYYPHIEYQKNHESGTSFLLSKAEYNSEIIRVLDFNQGQELVRDSLNHDYCTIVDSLEFSPSIEISLDSLSFKASDFIDFSVEIKPHSAYRDISLVSVIENEDSLIHWSATNIHRFDMVEEWITGHHSINLNHIKSSLENARLKTYIWNKEKLKFEMDNFRVSRRNGNPIVYGLYKEIDY